MDQYEKTTGIIDNCKTITLTTNEYIFDVNTLFLPFLTEYKGNKIQKIEVQQGESKISILGSSDYGVPTVYDKLTLTALQRIFFKQRSINNSLYLKTENITEEDRTIEPVLVTHIAQEMGYSGNISMNVKARICDSIRRLSYTTYVSSSDRTFDHKNQKFLMRAEEGTRLLKYKMITITEEEKAIRRKKARKTGSNLERKKQYTLQKEKVFEGSIQITFDEIVYKAMACDQILYYKTKQVEKIHNTFAKNIYMLILKLAGKSKEYKISFTKLLTYFPVKQEYSYARAKELTKRTLNKLEESQVCTISYLNNDVIHFSFKPKTKKKVNHEYDYMTNKFCTFGEMLQGYIDLGLTYEEVLNLNLQKQRYYEALVRYATIRNKYGNIAKPREFVLSYIENEFPIDKKYYSK